MDPMPQEFREHLHTPLYSVALLVSLGLVFVAVGALLLAKLATDRVQLGVPPDSVAAPVAASVMALAFMALGVGVAWSAWSSLQDCRSGQWLARDVEVLRTTAVRGGVFVSFRDASGKEGQAKVPASWRIGVLPQRARLWTASHSGTPLKLELLQEGLRHSVLPTPEKGPD